MTDFRLNFRLKKRVDHLHMMTKVDARLFGYVPCSDVIETHAKKIHCGLRVKQCSNPKVECNQEEQCVLQTEDEGHLKQCSFQYGDVGAYFPDNQIQNEVDLCRTSTVIDPDDCDICQKCREPSLNETFDETNEKSLLQGKCNRHQHELSTFSCKDGGVGKTYNESKKTMSKCSKEVSLKCSPLSNYHNRKRTPSGGSVIKQIQIAIEKEEEEVKEACKSCECKWKLHLAMFTLLFANLLNYMDRYTIAGKETLVSPDTVYNKHINLCISFHCVKRNPFLGNEMGYLNFSALTCTSTSPTGSH